MHVYTFWWMSLETPKCGQSQLEASTPRQCAVFRPSVLKITSPSSFCFCASSFCSVSTRTALRKERGSAGQHFWACARYWSEFFGHVQHLEPTWISPCSIHNRFILQSPTAHDWKTTWCPWPARQHLWRSSRDGKPTAWSLKPSRSQRVLSGLQADFCNAPSWIVCLFILRLHSVMHCWTMKLYSVLGSIAMTHWNGARLRWAWWLHIS